MSDGLIPGSKSCQRRQTGYMMVGFLGWCIVMLGCVPSKVQVQSAPQFDPSAISSIAILPFQTLQSPNGAMVKRVEV